EDPRRPGPYPRRRRGGAALHVPLAVPGPRDHTGRRVVRNDGAEGRPHAALDRLGEPRRAGIPRSGSFRRDAPARAAPGARPRRALLPGCVAGAAGEPRGPRGARQALPALYGRRGALRARPHVERARLRARAVRGCLTGDMSLAALEALVPRIRAAADETEAARRLSLPLVHALADAGGFRLCVPPAPAAPPPHPT